MEDVKATGRCYPNSPFFGCKTGGVNLRGAWLQLSGCVGATGREGTLNRYIRIIPFYPNYNRPSERGKKKVVVLHAISHLFSAIVEVTRADGTKEDP